MQKNKKSVLIFLMSIVLILAFGGCSDDNNPTNDGISPEILSVYPPNGSTGVSVATPIIIVFSENVDISTFAPSALRPADTSFIISPPTAVNVSYSGDSVFIIPYYNLMFGRDYIITISDYIKDKDGNKLKTAANWTFKTGEEIVPLSANNLWIFYDSLQQIDTINIYDTSYYFFYDTLIDSTFQLDSIVKDSNIELIFLLTDTPSVDPLIIDTLFIDTIWNVFNVSYY
ncbi:MAG: Ig-like domain-containing protein, partial [Candidatus Zixiibacteriota bacterium]